MLQFGCGQQQSTVQSLCRPSPCWGGEEHGKKKAKTRGSGKGSLTETANEGKCNNNNTDKENIQKKQQNAQSNSHCPMSPVLPSHD